MSSKGSIAAKKRCNAAMRNGHIQENVSRLGRSYSDHPVAPAMDNPFRATTHRQLLQLAMRSAAISMGLAQSLREAFPKRYGANSSNDGLRAAR